MSKPILEIKGLTSKVDILTSIKEDIENGNKDNAIDNLNQLIDYETKPIEDENGMSIGQGRLW
jgi:hypothetical protein